ncbi:MAG: zinc-dependent peptidase [Pirellulaceae bacterium]
MVPIFLLGWWRAARRKRIASRDFPAAWLSILETNVDHYPRLGAAAREHVRRYVQLFVTERHWEGCNGLTLTDEIRVTIAAQVAVMMQGYPDVLFDRVPSILVYPTSYKAQGRRMGPGGLVLEGQEHREGEAWYRGPVVLSWRDVWRSARAMTTPHNLVVHEFAHQLDMLDGRDVDGMPPQPNTAAAEHWQTVLKRERADLEESIRQRDPWLDPYANTNAAEFFAVASETFFEAPWYLAAERAELYQLLADFYKVDPRDWLPAEAA